MTALKVVLLICAASTPRIDCSVETALDIIQGPETYAVAGCGMQSQAYLAGTALASRLEDGSNYLKILCGRDPLTRVTEAGPKRDQAMAATPTLSASD